MRISVQEAVKKLNAGDVVAIPTETVYGLAARYDNTEAVEKIFQLKKRPKDNPLIIHLPAASAIHAFTAKLPPFFEALAEAFWPGPLTLVVPVNKGAVPLNVCAGLATQAFRIPHHSVAQELIQQTGPLVAPSANLSGRPSSVTVEHVETDFGAGFPVVDGGECAAGVESTILIYDDGMWKLGRLGAIAPEAFVPVLGYLPVIARVENKPLCPGQRYRHYAPRSTLHLGVSEDARHILGFKGRRYPSHAVVWTWGNGEDPEETVHELYSFLRRLDSDGIKEAWVDTAVPQAGLWQTYLERLKKAASGK